MTLPVVLVLASGRGERFTASGGTVHKLQALLDGKSVLQHTLDAVRASGLPWHLEACGHAGMGDAIAASVRATRTAPGWLILPGDLPLVQAETLRLVATALRFAPIVVPLYRGKRGHPVAFTAGLRRELENLHGDRGAGVLLQGHPVTQLVTGDIGCVVDVDTLADLQAVQQLRAGRDLYPPTAP
jgi:molybdenum cofactor cytidylyltransferase